MPVVGRGLLGLLDVGAELAAGAQVVRLPGRDGRDARHLAQVAGAGHGDRRVGRRRHQHDVDALADELLGHLARPAGVGLAVAVEDLDRVAVGVLHGGQDEGVGLAERRQRAGAGRDVADAGRRDVAAASAAAAAGAVVVVAAAGEQPAADAGGRRSLQEAAPA